MRTRELLVVSSTSMANLMAKPEAPTKGPSAEAPCILWVAIQPLFFSSTALRPCQAMATCSPSTETMFGDQYLSSISFIRPALNMVTMSRAMSPAEGPEPVETLVGPLGAADLEADFLTGDFFIAGFAGDFFDVFLAGAGFDLGEDFLAADFFAMVSSCDRQRLRKTTVRRKSVCDFPSLYQIELNVEYENREGGEDRGEFM